MTQSDGASLADKVREAEHHYRWVIEHNCSQKEKEIEGAEGKKLLLEVIVALEERAEMGKKCLELVDSCCGEYICQRDLHHIGGHSNKPESWWKAKAEAGKSEKHMMTKEDEDALEEAMSLTPRISLMTQSEKRVGTKNPIEIIDAWFRDVQGSGIPISLRKALEASQEQGLAKLRKYCVGKAREFENGAFEQPKHPRARDWKIMAIVYGDLIREIDSIEERPTETKGEK